MGSSSFVVGLLAFSAISAFIQASMGGGGEIITPVDQLVTLLSSF